MNNFRIQIRWAVFLITLASATVSAQSNVPDARKFDEFGDIENSDLMARLDNFAITLSNEPASRGFIMVYQTRRDLPGLSHRLGLRIQNYLVAQRGLPKARVIIVEGGVAGCLVQELWIVPPGTAPKPRDDVRIGYFHYADSAWKFDEYGFLPPEQYRRFVVPRVEEPSADHLEAFAKELKKKRDQLACVIVYAQYFSKPGMVDYSGSYEPRVDVRLDLPGTAQRRLALEKNYLIREYGIPASRIRTIDGGYRKHRTVELWILPAGEPLPIPTPNSIPSRRKK